MAKSMTTPKYIKSLESDVNICRQQLANVSIALRFLKELGVSKHAEKYIGDILKLSEKALTETDKEKYN